MPTLVKRILTGSLVVLLTIIAVYAADGMYVPVLFAVVMNVGLYEWQRLCKNMGFGIPVFWLFLLGNLAYFSLTLFFYEQTGNVIASALSMPAVWIMVAAMASMFVWAVMKPEKGRWEKMWVRLGLVLAGVSYISVSLALLCFLSAPYQGGNPNILMGFFVMIWAADVFAYVVGSLLGKHKLCERLSPSKTWEGAIGGFVLALIGGLLWFLFVLDGAMSLHSWMGMSALVVLCGMIGDLLESKLKREAGVKDSGTILPGHGGILDRFDSVLLAAPVAVAFLHLIELF